MPIYANPSSPPPQMCVYEFSFPKSNLGMILINIKNHKCLLSP